MGLPCCARASTAVSGPLRVYDGRLISGAGPCLRRLPNQMVMFPLQDILATWRDERAFEAGKEV